MIFLISIREKRLWNRKKKNRKSTKIGETVIMKRDGT